MNVTTTTVSPGTTLWVKTSSVDDAFALQTSVRMQNPPAPAGPTRESSILTRINKRANRARGKGKGWGG